MSDDSGKDRIFAKRLQEVRAFEFNETVAEVFHDMISRSVPGYGLLLRMIGLYADLFVQPGTRVYDLGCSLGEATLIIADQTEPMNSEIIAVDNSPAMIDKCRQYQQHRDRIDWRCEDIQRVAIDQASLVVLNLTLQFLQPEERWSQLERIYAGLVGEGVLVLSEKVAFASEIEDRRMTQLYQAYKKTMGYSDLEISQKRNALENVLIPDTGQAHEQRLRELGFREVYQCFRGFNFVSYLAIKT